MFTYEENWECVRNNSIDTFAAGECARKFAETADRALCTHTSMAGQSIAHLIKAYLKESVDLRYETPDSTQVSQTHHS